MPHLSKLDTLNISDDAKAFAEATFMKKRMYYNMRIKTIQRNASNVIKLLKTCKRVKNFKIDIDMTKLSKRLNAVVRELEERSFVSQLNEGFDHSGVHIEEVKRDEEPNENGVTTNGGDSAPKGPTIKYGPNASEVNPVSIF